MCASRMGLENRAAVLRKCAEGKLPRSYQAQRHEDVRGNEGIVLCVLNLDARWR